MLQERQQFGLAYTLAREVTDTFRRLGQRFDLAWALHQLALAAVHTERVDEAFAATVEATEILLGLKDTSGIPILLGDFSDIALASGDKERAMRLRGASAAIQEQTGAGLEASTAGVYNYRFEVEPDEAERELLERAFADGWALDQEEAIAYALGRAPVTDIT
jgi:hypothetical protein